MSDGAISQDEIDALLSGVAIDGLNSSGHVGNGPTYHFDIPTLQSMADALKPKLEENINKTTSVTFTTGFSVVNVTLVVLLIFSSSFGLSASARP